MTVSELIRELREKVLESPRVANQVIMATSHDSGRYREDLPYEITTVEFDNGEVLLG